jgi:hypothetical protein
MHIWNLNCLSVLTRQVMHTSWYTWWGSIVFTQLWGARTCVMYKLWCKWHDIHTCELLCKQIVEPPHVHVEPLCSVHIEDSQKLESTTTRHKHTSRHIIAVNFKVLQLYYMRNIHVHVHDHKPPHRRSKVYILDHLEKIELNLKKKNDSHNTYRRLSMDITQSSHSTFVNKYVPKTEWTWEERTPSSSCYPQLLQSQPMSSSFGSITPAPFMLPPHPPRSPPELTQAQPSGVM